MNVEFIKSTTTGGHYGFRNEKSKTVFTNKMTEAKMVSLRPDDVVVDIGAYVGEYSLYAQRNGAGRVIAYEATPNTFEVLKKNSIGKFECHNKAVVGTDDDHIDLHIANGIGVTNSIAKSRNKVDCISVPAIKYDEAVKDATVVKIDVEGAEYSYNIFQPHLRAYILEFHPMSGMDYQKEVGLIIEELKDNGYKTLCEPGFKHGWDLHGAWIKDD